MTTPPPQLASLVERKFLLIKRGLYYRPDSMGYTGIKEYAGRYLESDASPESGVKAVHEDDAADYSPACFEDLKIDHLKGKIAEAATALEALAAERDALRKDLQWYADQFCELGTSHECCGRMTSDECSGCLARATLNGAPQP